MNQTSSEVGAQVLAKLIARAAPQNEAAIVALINEFKGPALREALAKSRLIDPAQYGPALAVYLGLEWLPHLPDPGLALRDQFFELVGIRFAKARACFPLHLEDQELRLAVVEPWPRAPYLEVARALGAERLDLVLTSPEELAATINRSFDTNQSSAEEAAEVLEGDQDTDYLAHWSSEETEDLLDAQNEEPIKRLMNSILFQAVKDNSSDIHIDPGFGETQVRYRVDGVLRPVTKVKKRGHIPLVNRVKVMAGLDISSKSKPQDGRTMILLAGKKIDIRVSIIPTIHGEQAVLRLLNQAKGIGSLAGLGFNPALANRMRALMTQPHGIVLVTGPTGSGKTTTLYAALAEIDSKKKNIVTIEDPVEYQIGDYGQMQVNEKTGLTFAKGLRAMLRQDPDVIMVGEMRDAETAQIAIQASLTGHLVLSTLHTNDAPSSVVRLIDMGIEPFLVSSTLTAAVAQRLVRLICPHCKEEHPLDKEELQQAGFLPQWLQGYVGHLWRGRGCEICLQSGYQGRSGVYELLMVTDPLRKAIAKGADASVIRQIAIEGGMLELSQDCAEKALAGLTSLEEFLRISASGKLNA